MKIYVLTQGSLMYHHIITATENKEKAEQLRDKFNEDLTEDLVQIEEYDSDKFDCVLNNEKIYTLTYSMSKSNILNINKSTQSWHYLQSRSGDSYYYDCDMDEINAVIKATSEEEALKIFNNELPRFEAARSLYLTSKNVYHIKGWCHDSDFKKYHKFKFPIKSTDCGSNFTAYFHVINGNNIKINILYPQGWDDEKRIFYEAEAHILADSEKEAKKIFYEMFKKEVSNNEDYVALKNVFVK